MSATMTAGNYAPVHTATVKIKTVNWGAVRNVAFACIYCLLLVSMWQAGSFLYERSEDPFRGTLMAGCIVAVIVLGHVCIYMFSLASSSGKNLLAVLCLMLIIPIESISMYTSAAKYNKSTFNNVLQENRSSPEYETAMRIIKQRESISESMLDRSINAPITHSSKSIEMNAQSSAEMDKAQEALSVAKNLDVSPTQKSYDALEEATGITPVAVNNSLAVFQSVGPALVAMYWGLIAGMRRINVIADDDGKGGGNGKK